MSADRRCGHHNVFLYLTAIFLVRNLGSVAELYDALGVCELCGCAENYGGIILLAELITKLYEVLCLLAISRLKNWNMRRTADHSGVLLVLGACHAGIVGNDYKRTAVNAGVGECVERVCSYVKTNVLHAGKASYAGDRCSDSNLCRHLLVGSPFGIYFIVFCEIFADFGAGSSGVCARKLNTRFVCAACYGFIAKHHCLV